MTHTYTITGMTCDGCRSKVEKALNADEGFEIIDELVENGAEGIILGCTEIPLLIKPSDSPVKTYDTTTIHARAILDYAMKESPAPSK